MAKENISVATTVLDVFTDDKVKELIELRPWMKTKKFVLLTKQQEIEAFFDECIKKGRCAYDLETTGLNTRIDPSTGLCYAKIVGICVSHDPDEGAYIPIAHEHADNYNVPLKFVIRETKRLAANCVLIFHNFKYDGAILKPHGVVFESEDQYEDTYLMAAIQDASRKEKGLKYLSGALLDRPQLEIDDLGIQGTAKNTVAFYLVPPQKAVFYGGGDAMNTMALYLYLKEQIDKQDPTGKEGPWAVYNVEKRCLFVTMEMENNLVKIDRKYLEETSKDVDLRMQKLIGDIYKIAGHQFDINSTKQLGVVLFEELGIPYPAKADKTKKGDYQTNSEILEMVSSKNPIVSMILTYRGYVKIKGTYLDNWLNNADENDEVKFKLNQIQADTGRFSGSGGYGLEIDGYCGVNCQNVPTWDKSDPHSINLRRAMVAHDGFKMLSIDYSGEELRIATNFSKEPKWVNEFLYGTGDLHTITGKIITGKSEITKKERSLGKCVAKGTLIASERGWIPIELIKKGDKVITHTGELKVVTDVWDMGVKPGIRIETRTGHRITCGLNHRYLTEADEWVRAEDLSKGTMIKTGSCANMDPQKIQRVHFNIWDKGNNSHVSEDLPYIEISPRWARLLGYILGDGSVNINHVSVVCSEIYTDVKDDIMKTAEGLGLSPKESKGRREREDGTYTKWLYKIHMGSRILVRFFREFGFSGRREWKDEKDSLTKHRSSKVFRVPPVIFSSPKYVIKEFLSALFETDGTVDAETSVTTKDRDLAEDLVLLLSMFGIRACIWDKFSKKYNKMYYKVSFGVAGSRIFEKEIGFISQDKKDRLYNLTHKQSKPHSGTYAVKWLSEVKETTLVGDVQLYDLTVDDDHTYIAQGLVTHNTVNFLTMYGGGAGGFAAQAKIPFEVAKKMILNFFKEYEGLNSWIKREWKASRNRGYSKTMLGRRRPLQEFYSSSDKGIQSKGDRCAINSAIQGTGADVIKIALWRVYRWIKDNGLENDVKILLPVHDEVLYEVRKEKLDIIVPELCRLMKIRDVTDKMKWVVPLDVDAEYGDSFHVDHDYWKEMKAKMKETPVPAPEPLAEEFKPESPEKPEPVVVTETQVREDIHDIAPKEKSQENGHSTSSVLGVTTNNTPGYYQQMVINERSVDNVTTRERVHNVLDSTEDNSDRTLFKDARINDNIDKEGFFNYKINVDLVSAQKIRFILELIRSSGNMFTGPKNRICLISKDGEVFLKTKDELSIDSFIALCIVFNV